MCGGREGEAAGASIIYNSGGVRDHNHASDGRRMTHGSWRIMTGPSQTKVQLKSPSDNAMADDNEVVDKIYITNYTHTHRHTFTLVSQN